MPELDRYIPGVPCWVDTSQPDPEAAVAFYGELFGWEFVDALPPGSEAKYSIAQIRGGAVAAVGSVPEAAPPQAMWNTYVRVASADETAAKVLDAGGSVLTEPFDIMQAGRMAVCADPEGAVFCIWEAKQRKGADIVNEHGSLNFNDLNTRDVDGAKAFYGAVFGWQTIDARGRLRDVDAARLRRPPRAAEPRHARADGGAGCAGGLRGRRRVARPDRRR